MFVVSGVPKLVGEGKKEFDRHTGESVDIARVAFEDPSMPTGTFVTSFEVRGAALAVLQPFIKDSKPVRVVADGFPKRKRNGDPWTLFYVKTVLA